MRIFARMVDMRSRGNLGEGRGRQRRIDVHDPFESGRSGQFWTRFKRRALAFDSWLDTFFYGLMANTGRGLVAYSAWLESFNMRGPRRLVFEGASEAATFGTVGAMLMLALARRAVDTHNAIAAGDTKTLSSLRGSRPEEATV